MEGDAKVLDGACARQIKDELRARVEALRSSRRRFPGLGTISVGEDPGSVAYVAGKHRDCAEVGIESIRVDLPAHATEDHRGRGGLNSDPAQAGVHSSAPAA